MNLPLARIAASAALLFAGTARSDETAEKTYTQERFAQLCDMVTYYADSGFQNMSRQFDAFKGYVDRGEGAGLADALLRLARENAGSTNETELTRFEFAMTWLDEFGETNALPFLLEEMNRDIFRKTSVFSPERDRDAFATRRLFHRIDALGHQVVSDYFRLANRKNARDALHAAADRLADERWAWLRGEFYCESMRALELHESLARTAVAKKGGGIVNLRPVREPICDFLAYCCENETDPGRFAHLDGYIRSRLPEWKASDRRLAMALRMQRLHPESEVASKVLRAVQDARASSRPGEDAAGGGGNIPTTGGAQQDDVSDTEVVPPYVPPPPGSEFRS